ncbi:hypothetical protein K7432_005358 [Basidiobolus ranarum]|uniref:HTH OST-type domain-containing protein n=1 Tax=Basidiobolus ranarum TaxID=34480 RepID=A0ABR2WWR3_9FUNG
MPKTWVECAVEVMKDSFDSSKLWTVVEILQDISRKDLKRTSGRNSYLALYSALMDDIQKPNGFLERQDGKFTLKIKALTETLEIIHIQDPGEENTGSALESDISIPALTPECPEPYDSSSLNCITYSKTSGSSRSLAIDLTIEDVDTTLSQMSPEDQISDIEYPFPAKLTQLERQVRRFKRESQVKMWRAREEREAREMRAQLRRQRVEVTQFESSKPSSSKARVNFALSANQIFEYTP